MLSIDLTAFIIFALVWILALVLSKVFFKPVTHVMDERASRLAADRERTSKAVEAYEGGLRRIEESLKAARTEAASIREKAEADALAEKSKAILDLQTESRAQLEQARNELRRQVESLKKELDGRVEEVASEIEKRMLN